MYKIGELARRAGLPVKTIRYYSDIGLLPERNRTQGRFRLYSDADLDRLRMVMALRELGFDLATIKSIIDQRVAFKKVLDLRLQAVDRDIKSFEQSRAVLRVLRDCDTVSADTAARLHEFGQLSLAERRRLVADFYRDAAQGRLGPPEFVATLRQASEVGPVDELTEEQLGAWLELAQLLADEDFRGRVKVMGRGAWGALDVPDVERLLLRGDEVVTRAAEACGADVNPSGPAAAAILDDFIDFRAGMLGRQNDREFRAWLLLQFEVHDPRAGRYWELIAIINRWPVRDGSSTSKAFHWLYAALKHRVAADANPPQRELGAR